MLTGRDEDNATVPVAIDVTPIDSRVQVQTIPMGPIMVQNKTTLKIIKDQIVVHIKKESFKGVLEGQKNYLII